MRQTKIGNWPTVNLENVAVAWEALRAQRGAGTDPALKRREAAAVKKAPVANGYTVRQLCNDYLDGHIRKHRQPKGMKETERPFNKRLDVLANKQAAAVTRADAFEFLEEQSDTPVSTAQLCGELAGAWDYALDTGRIPDTSPNWWRLVMRGRLRSKGKVMQGKNIGVVKRVLSEADGLWWIVPKVKTKNARHALAADRRVPLVGRVEAIVRRCLADYPSGYLFPARDSEGKAHSEQAVVQSQVHYYQPYSKTSPKHVRPRLPVTHWAPHDLRRTSRTLLAAMGCPDSVAEALLGHVQPGIQGTYNRHGYDRERRLWLSKLDVKLEHLAEISFASDNLKNRISE